MSSEAKNLSSSFRDPAGFVFNHSGKIYRQINFAAKQDYDTAKSSGLYKALFDKDLLIKHSEVSSLSGLQADADRYKIIRPEPVPFISYPYEWTFSQLKQAAQLTLRIQKLALSKGMILKDASAYNVQFIGDKPIFIDTLSFRIYEPGAPWDGYKQFCQHFLAPLAIANYTRLEVIKLLQIYLDGLPLDLASNLLPVKARRRWGLLSHIYMHAATQRRYTDNEDIKAPKSRSVSATAMNGIISSLDNSVAKLSPPKNKSLWGNYYEFTNYSSRSFSAKKKLVANYLDKISPKPTMVWDLGANDGTFTELAAKKGAYCLAFDVDYQALEFNVSAKRPDNIKSKILPLAQDWTNPSPALGWAHAERRSLIERGPADAVMALAVIHHLAIGNNLPFSDIAQFFSQIGKNVIIEFVPKSDSKVKLLLRSREDIFTKYDQINFEKAFEKYFRQIEKKPVPGSDRDIYLYKVK